jgi:hypothetical protein
MQPRKPCGKSEIRSSKSETNSKRWKRLNRKAKRRPKLEPDGGVKQQRRVVLVEVIEPASIARVPCRVLVDAAKLDYI